MSGYFKFGCFLSVAIIILAYLYKKRNDDSIQDRLAHVLSGLLRAEKKVPLQGKTRVALGFGSCSDIFVDALSVIGKLDISPPEEPLHHDSVNSTQQLAQLAAYFFQHGAAAERYVSNMSLFQTILDISDNVQGRHWHLGGNAPVMANRMAMEGLDVLLGARLTNNLASSLSPNVKVSGKKVDEEDVHIILEYKSGEKWGKYVSPRANRLILHSDSSNPHLQSLEDFQEELKSFKPALIVIGGLQMMDNFPFLSGERIQRLTKLKNMILGTSADTKIHFEMASFTDSTLLKEIYDNVMIHSDSLGMNEQELPNLVSLLTSGKITLVSDSYPRVATVLDQMRFVYQKMRNNPKAGRKLTRLHVHTLAYQAILTTKSSSWKNTMSATAKASLTAHRHVCGSKYIDVLKSKLIMDESFSRSVKDSNNRVNFLENRPVSCWEESDYQICVAPVLVCTNVLQTAGGGDNISSAGLVLQL